MTKLYILSFLFSFHIALSAFINSTFLESIIKENDVGILYTISSLVILILLSKNSNFLKEFGNKKLTLIFLILNMISLIGLITSNNPYIIGVSFIVFFATNVLVMFGIDIFIEHFSDIKKIGKVRSIYITIVSAAWLISPIISGYIINITGGYKLIYIIAFIGVTIMTLGLIFSVKNFKDKTYERAPFLKTYKYLKKNDHMFSIMIINFLLQFFYAWMVVYTPIYLHEYLAFTWPQIGIIFTIMLSPFLIFSIPTGYIIDKYKANKKKILYLGFFILGVSTISMSQFSTLNIYTWASILFLTRVGASIIETTSEVYLFTHIKEEDTHLLGIYRDMGPFAYLIAPLIATGLLYFISFKYLFLVLGILVFSSFYFINKLINNHDNHISS